MKTFKFLIVGAFILMMNSAYAQRDMILTQAGEEVRCRIIDETPVRFVFAYLKDGKPYRSEIFKNLVTSFKFNYYDADLPNADKLPEAMYRAIEGTDSQSPRALSTNTKKTSKKRKRNKKGKVEEENVASESMRETFEEEGLGEKKAESTASNSTKTVSQPSGKIDRSTTSRGVASTIPPKSGQKQQKEEKAANDASLRRVTTNNSPKREDKNESVKESVAIADERGEGDLETKSEQSKNAVAESKPATKANITETELPNITINQKNKFRVGIKGGIGNRLDNNLQTTNSFDLYQEQLLRGWTLGADVAYFPNDAVGFGVVYTDFQSRNSDSEILYRNEFTGAEQIGSIANKRSVKFVGPALFLRKKLDYKTYVVLGLSPGYNFYTDNGNYESVDYTFKGGGFGVASTLGVDFLLGNDIIGRDIILSFEAGYNYGKLNSLDYGDARGAVDVGTPIDLSRLDFTIGLRFIRFPKYFRLTSY